MPWLVFLKTELTQNSVKAEVKALLILLRVEWSTSIWSEVYILSTIKHKAHIKRCNRFNLKLNHPFSWHCESADH